VAFRVDALRKKKNLGRKEGGRKNGPRKIRELPVLGGGRPVEKRMKKKPRKRARQKDNIRGRRKHKREREKKKEISRGSQKGKIGVTTPKKIRQK